jgi:hypothetical protein
MIIHRLRDGVDAVCLVVRGTANAGQAGDQHYWDKLRFHFVRLGVLTNSRRSRIGASPLSS